MNVQLVNDHWLYKEATTIEDVSNKNGRVTFSWRVLENKINKLVSWMMYHLSNGMSRLHTLEEHNRKG